jgi:phage protein D
MIAPKKPTVSLTVAGVVMPWQIGGDLKEFTYRDVHHGEVDEISFKLADGRGLWRGDWGIDAGTQVSGQMGYSGIFGPLVPCGLYTVGESEAQGDGRGDICVVHAQSAFTSKELRTKRSEAFDNMALKDVLEKGAARHGMTLLGDVPDLTFERLTQTKESDLTFWTRVARDVGAYFSVKGEQLVFTSRASIESSEAVRIFELGSAGLSLSGATSLKRYTVRKSTHKLYSKATGKYLHPKTGEVLTAEISDPRVPSGDTLKLTDRGETKAHIEHMLAARLAAENDRLGTGKLTLVGDPLLLAGQVVSLGASFGTYAGRWLVTSAQHRFTSAGYTTVISIKLI